MRGLNTDSVDLIYLDPPFNSDEEYGDPLGGDGHFKDKWTLKDVDHFEHGQIAEANDAAYKVIEAARATEGKKAMAYLIFMAVRLIEIERILKPTGSVFLHCDDNAEHHLRNLMDAVFGAARFRSRIIWKRTSAKNNAENIFGRISDCIFHYAGEEAPFHPQFTDHDENYLSVKYVNNDDDGRGFYRLSDPSAPSRREGLRSWKGYAELPPSRIYSIKKMEELDADDRIHYPRLPDGSPDYSKRVSKKVYLKESKGQPVGNIWMDIPPVNAMAKEALKYPTQKPKELLERIIACSTKQNDLVFDPFCGCATTLVTADGMGRRWIGCDISPLAVEKLYERLTKDERKGRKNEDAVKPLLTRVIKFDVRDKDEKGRKLRRNDPLPVRTDSGVGFVKRDIRHDLYGKQEGYCFGCWTHQRIEFMHIDHRNSKHDGGQNDPSNMQLLCAPCNQSKNKRSMSKWRADKKSKHPEAFELEEARRIEVEAKLGH